METKFPMLHSNIFLRSDVLGFLLQTSSYNHQVQREVSTTMVDGEIFADVSTDRRRALMWTCGFVFGATEPLAVGQGHVNNHACLK